MRITTITASPFRSSLIRRLSGAALAGLFALGLVLAHGGPAFAADEDEEDSFETKVMKSILGIGDQDKIEYRERAPLVVPPTSALPQPEKSAVVNDPAWPKDAEVQERKARKAAAKQRRKTADEEDRPLTPAELDAGRRAGAGRVTEARPGDQASESGRPLLPSQLGRGNKSLLGALFDKREKEETAVFSGEPPRTSLTAPPPGYQTPSPAQPYGLTAKREAAKPYNVMEKRGTDGY